MQVGIFAKQRRNSKNDETPKMDTVDKICPTTVKVSPTGGGALETRKLPRAT